MNRCRSHAWMMFVGALALTALVLPLIASTGVMAAVLQATQATPVQCFPETGKCVRGAFLNYWKQHGGLEQFGFPISDEIMERNAPPPAGDGQEHLVQYFERARFEFHENPGKGASNVKLGLLGSEQWQSRHAASPPPSVKPQAISDPVEFCAKAGTVDYPAWLYQGAYAFTGTVKDPDSGASVGLRCLDGKPLICSPGASDWICNKVNWSTTPPETTSLYCQIKGEDGSIPGAYVDKTSAYLWTCQAGKAVIEKQVVTEDQVDDRGYRIDSWKPLPGAAAQPSAPPTALTGPLWAWQGTQMSDGKLITVADPSRYTVQFMPDGTLAARLDCNNASGTFTYTAPSGLTIVLGPTTLVACPPDTQDAIFRQQLSDIVSYVMRDGDLYLAIKVDSGIMHFAPMKPTTLTGTTWSANGINNGHQAVQSVVTGTTVTAVFGTDGQVTGSAGCNTYSGPYTVTGNAIAIGPLASSRMACEPPIMTQEASFLTAMQNAKTWKITADRLELRDAAGALQVGFAAKTMAAVTGTVNYLQKIALVSGSVVAVRLQDVSRADAPAILLGEQLITTTGQQVPIPFEITYDPSTINEQNTYTVRATINDPAGKLIFNSTTAIPVITRGAPTSGIEIVVQPV